ncbi:MAG TPA: GNAT family N-acetyltransferase [Kofleriaceae bacterium]|nr:GNAT family N-acetyltransferase [Kofleriaceae bacterium]
MQISVATSVRCARLSDTSAVTDLVNRAFAIERFFFDGDRTTSDEIERLIRAGWFLVVEASPGLCATVLFQGPGQRAGLPPSHAYFGMLSVLPEVQRSGLGRQLVQLVEAKAAQAGATAMHLRVINLREELSRWYNSLGYREVGITPYNHVSLKRPCHFIEMTKPLAPAGDRAGAESGAA